MYRKIGLNSILTICNENMQRITKKLVILVLGVLASVFYCEFVIYYVVIAQCEWPVLVEHSYKIENTLKSLIIADPHLLGPFRGHWLDKWRRETEMHRAFQTILTIHKPEVVFVLGDLFDEGEWTSNKQFEEYVKRFHVLFSVPDYIKMYVVVGNHDIGFHNNIRRGSAERFTKMLNTPSVQLLTIKNNHFVLMNSMAMEGDSCRMCTAARRDMEKVSETLQCAESPTRCKSSIQTKLNYSQPIFMQHFPLYRISDSVCTEPDAPPFPDRNKPFRNKIDALSKEATEYIVAKVKPRAAFGGHTHHGCLVRHEFRVPEKVEFDEYSVPSFSWRNRPNPKYMLVTFTPDTYAVSKCGLPRETTIAITGLLMIVIVATVVLKMRSIGRIALC